MSLILDALNRSRQDLGEVPGLDSQHQVPESRSSSSQRWWILALVVALAVIAWLLYERGGESTPAAQTPQPAIVAETGAVRPQAPAPVPEKQAAPAPAPTVPAAPPVAPEAPAVLEKAPVAEAEVAALYAKKSVVAEAPTVAEPGAKTKVEKPVSPPPVVKETVSEQPVDIEAMVNQAQDDLENAQLEEHPAPFLTSLSQQSKDSIPTIFYERHDYSGKPGQSAVVLNGKTLKPGGRTSAGVRVDEILPGSVVLTYQGTQFRLRALNSWVNL